MGLLHNLLSAAGGQFGWTKDWNMGRANEIQTPQNAGFRNTANDYKGYINTNTGENGYNTGYDMGVKNATDLTKRQSNGASSTALGNAMSVSGITKGRAADSAASEGSNTYAANYANNVNNQQTNANQALANQLNAQGTLMGANLTNDQAEYQQGWNNYSQGSKINAGAGFTDLFSDENLKDKAKVGLGDGGDLRMECYKRCGDKLKHMNPNKWEELKWRAR